MQRGRGGMDDFFGFSDPFGSFGGSGRPGSLISGFFGGRDPFDDPFFTQPFGGMMGPRMFGHGMFGAGGSPFGVPDHAGFLEDQPPQPKKSKGPIIQEITSDDEVEEQGEEVEEKIDGWTKHSTSGKEPYVQDPDEETQENRSKLQQRAEYKRAGTSQPQNLTYSFHSSTVTYGGHNGAYYTASTTRRSGGDGVTLEENREADTTTGKATHRVSRGIGDKGHSVTRKLNSDGKVDTVQTLHNLNEDELARFEEAWKGNERQHLPGWNQGLGMWNDGVRGGSSAQSGQSSRGWALPPAEQRQYAGPMGFEARPRRDFSNGRRSHRH